jgi:ankyrin repeat protein
LISQGLNINITNASKVTALSIACENNNFDMVSFLLNKNIEFDTISIIGLKPLLEQYRDTATELSNEILQDVYYKFQRGPSYLQKDYGCLVEKILRRY